MSNSILIENLISFGLTRQEAGIYIELLKHGEMTGYEVSKDLGISRSNVYGSLSTLVEKGACYLIQGEATKYTPVSMSDFVENQLYDLKEKGEILKKNAPEKIEEKEGYITIQGAKNIRDKIRNMIKNTSLRLYILASYSILKDFEDELKKLVEKGLKVVILSENCKIKGCENYLVEPKEGQLRLITDSSYVLTGELTESEHDTCLYSGQKNLVEVMKEALKNQIILLKKNKK